MAQDDEFRVLVEKYKNTVYRVAYSCLKNRDDAEDAFQDVFLKYLRTQPEFNSEEHAKAWLIRVCVNTCKSYHRSPWQSKVEPLEASEGTFDTYEDARDSELLETLSKLSQKYSAVLHLFYYEDYSVREIARILEISEKNVLVRLHRARKKLKEFIKEDYCYEHE